MVPDPKKIYSHSVSIGLRLVRCTAISEYIEKYVTRIPVGITALHMHIDTILKIEVTFNDQVHFWT